MEITLIKDLKVGTRNVNLFFIVIEVAPRATTTKEGAEIRTCKVADRSACINLSIWGELGNFIQPGDICKLTKGYVANWKNTPTLYMGKGGELVKTSEFCMLFNEAVNLSEMAGANAAGTANNPQVPPSAAPNIAPQAGNNQATPVLEIE